MTCFEIPFLISAGVIEERGDIMLEGFCEFHKSP
jgi:hypothetical protein